jgi:hypothetical protein
MVRVGGPQRVAVYVLAESMQVLAVATAATACAVHVLLALTQVMATIRIMTTAHPVIRWMPSVQVPSFYDQL